MGSELVMGSGLSKIKLGFFVRKMGSEMVRDGVRPVVTRSSLSFDREGAVEKMRVGPSDSPDRRRLQTT